MSASLRELQEQFQAYVLNENDHILNTISTELSDAIDRIDVYKDGYSLRLLEVLEKDFPVLCKRIGCELFREIGREYVDTYPSDNFSICIFSRHFSNFLIDTGREPYWSEIAAFEWALERALDAGDAPQISVNELAAIAGESWPYIQFDFHPSAEVYQFHFNAPQICYAMMLEEDTIPEPVKNDKPVDWVVWRKDMQSYFETITLEQVWIVSAIRQGKTFGEICEGLCQYLPEEEVAMFAAGSLRNWLEKGLFSCVRVYETVTA